MLKDEVSSLIRTKVMTFFLNVIIPKIVDFGQKIDVFILADHKNFGLFILISFENKNW